MQITKCEITVPVCILEGANTRTSGMWGLLSSSAEVSGFLEYQLYVEGIVVYF